MTFKPDPSQEAVMSCRSKICVVAGAGSGKTGTLVESICLRLEESLKNDKALSILEILALTFTDKAAAEMRQRLAKAFEVRRKKAESLKEINFWREQKNSLDRATIGTIHSFAFKLLQKNPLNLGFSSPPVLDEDSRSLKLDIEEIIRDLLDESDNELIALLKIYSLNKLEAMLEKCISKISSWGLKKIEISTNCPFADYPALIRSFKGLAKEGLALVENGDLNREKDYYQKVLFAMKRLNAELNSTIKDGDLDQNLASWAEIIKEGGAWYSKQGKPMRQKIIEALDEIQKFRDEERALTIKKLFLNLLNKTNDRLNSLKRKRGNINFDDILILARRLLAQNPELRKNEAEYYKLVVVDEFQDTNRLQADLLAYLLLKASDTKVYDEDYPIWQKIDWNEASDGFIIFGDLKQSIYRFRGAEVDIMAGLSHKYNKAEEAINSLPARDANESKTLRLCEAPSGQSCGLLMSIDRNYRSQASLVKFFNALFPSTLEAMFSELDFQKNKREDLYSGPHIVNLSSDASSRPNLSADRAKAQADILCRYLDDLFSGRLGLALPNENGGLRAVEPKDVAILFRAFTRVPTFKEKINEYGWHACLAAGDKPFELDEVKGLVAAASFLWGLDSEISLAAALRSPLGPVSDDALSILANKAEGSYPFSSYFLKNQPWPQELRNDDLLLLNSLKKLFQELKPLVGRLKFVEIMERLLEERKLLPLMALQGEADDKIKILTDFLGLCRNLGQSSRARKLGPLQELLAIRRNWDLRQDGTKSNSSKNAINLMTVHASKGLEFPIVIIAEADRASIYRSDAAQISIEGQLAISFKDQSGREVKANDFQAIEENDKKKEIEENARLLYVAATRARDHLVFLAWPDKKIEEKRKKTEGKFKSESCAWLEMVLDEPKAAIMMEKIEYEVQDSTQASSISKNILPETRDMQQNFNRALPLLNMELKSKTFAVTALGSLLADPEKFIKEYLLGAEEASSTFTSKKPFFPVNRKKNKDEQRKLSPSSAGSLFHAALEILNPLKADSENIVEKEAKRLGLEASKAEIKTIAHKIDIFLNHPLGLSWQESWKNNLSTWRELAFTMQIDNISTYLSKLSLNGIIDLVYETTDGAMQIVDYKLADFASDKSLIAYEHQVRIYAQALIANGFTGVISASLYFAGGDKELAYQVKLDKLCPFKPVLIEIKKIFQSPLNNRPLRPIFPEALNVVHLPIT